MAIAKVILNGVTQMDVTGKTVTAGSMLSGATALKNDGTDITGNIESKTSSDLTASGATVTAPAGYYASAASKSVASGSASTPATTITANPTVSVNFSGLITASVSKTQSVTPSVSAGYVSSGTAGTVTVSGSGTSQLTTQAAQTIHPSTTDQTIASGKYLTGAQTIKAVTTTNLTAANIVQGVTVKIGDSTDDDCVASVTGTASGGGSDADYIGMIERTTTATSLPSTITKIGDHAFYYCSDLDLSELPSGVTRVGAYAFFHCTKTHLSSLPSGITYIGEYAFYYCTQITLTALPSGITSIPAYAFGHCEAMTLSTLPSGVTNIGGYAFNSCIRMTSISCAGTITTLSSNAFTGSTSYPMKIAHASFPNMAVSSLSYAFGSTTSANACKLLEDADIGNTAAIAANAFANCYKLQTLILRKSDAICTLANVSAFLNTPIRGYNSLTGTIYVPSALISTYQTATNWATVYAEGHVTFAAIEGSQYEL